MGAEEEKREGSKNTELNKIKKKKKVKPFHVEVTVLLQHICEQMIYIPLK